jgi:hypothetical protein
VALALAGCGAAPAAPSAPPSSGPPTAVSRAAPAPAATAALVQPQTRLSVMSYAK